MSSKHGMWRTKINVVWLNIMARCYNSKNPAYHNYGGRGIGVFHPWHDFNRFYLDVGDVPEGLELDRINNDGDYEPGNIRWVTKRDNARNRRTNLDIEIGGVTKSLAEWVEEAGVVNYHTAYRRLGRGWEPQRAITTPSK